VNYTCGSKTEPQIIEARYTYGEPYNRITGAPAWEAPEETVYFAVGVPEVRYVRKNATGQFVPEELIFYGDPKNPGDDAAYYIEMKVPVGTPTPKTVKLQTANPCRAGVQTLIGAVATLSQDVALDVAPDQPAPDRYLLLRSPPIVSTSERIATNLGFEPSQPPDGQDPEEIGPPIYPVPSGVQYPSSPSLIIQQGIEHGYASVIAGFSPEETKTIRRGINSLMIAPPTAQAGFKWNAIPKTDVILRDQPLNIFLVVKEKDAPATKTVNIWTSRTKPEPGIPIELTKVAFGIGETDPSKDIYEYRATITGNDVIVSGLLPANVENGVPEFACLDYSANPNPEEGSSTDDSVEFVNQMVGLGLPLNERDMGIARAVKTADGISWITSLAPVSTAFLRAGGCEKLQVGTGTLRGTAFIQHQADWFYYSGHGDYLTPVINWNKSSFDLPDGYLNVNDIQAQKPWAQKLKRIIIAGCSLLDIKDYNRGFRKKYKFLSDNTLLNPGKVLAESGVKETLLGYNFYAPADNHFGATGYTSEIVKKYFERYKVKPQPEEQPGNWLEANKTIEDTKCTSQICIDHGRTSHGNSCGIDVSNSDKTQWKYYYWDKHSAPNDPTQWEFTGIPQTQW